MSKIQEEKNNYQIVLLNKKIETLEYELKLQQLAQKGEGYLDYELNLWQKKTNTLSSIFYQRFNNLKSSESAVLYHTYPRYLEP